MKLSSVIIKPLSDLIDELGLTTSLVAMTPVTLPALKKPKALIDGELEIPDHEIEHDERGRGKFLDHLVLLYIKDQGGQLEAVLSGDVNLGKMIHLRRCSKVKELAADGRADRYTPIIRDDGLFPVHREGYNGKSKEHLAKRRVCLLCLNELGLSGLVQGYGDRRNMAANFNYEAYLNGALALHDLILPSDKKPIIKPATDKKNSDSEWSGISRDYRADKNWCCESCSVDLSTYKYLLHTHHRNGSKSDHRSSNLQALCKVCHAGMPLHASISVKNEERSLILDLRS